METDLQEQVESPLIEDFLDCDQFGSNSDGGSSSSSSPKRAFKRLHIDVEMTSAQYLTPAAHHSEPPQFDGLPACSSGPQAVSYSSPDLDPYSAVSGVSSFNYPAAADPSLLTPVSSAGSPPLPHKQSSKPLRNFHPPQGPTQAPTPPNSSKMYYSGYEVSSDSQSPSPMTVNPAATEAGPFDMGPYMAHSPPISHHPSSPKTDIPPPIDPYLGHFTVSGPDDGDVTHHSLQEYHPYGVEVGPPGGYLGGQHVPVGTPLMHDRNMPSNGHMAPVLPQSHPPHFRPHPAPHVGSIEDLRDPSMLMGAYPARGALSPGRRPQPRKKSSSSKKGPRGASRVTARIGSAINGGQLNSGDDEEELTLRDDAPADDKYLFQLRKEFLSEKGKGMWEEMKAKYSEKHQGNWEKAALQMKVSRAVAKYGVWPEKEIERLKEAFQYYEEKRYQLIIARMKENGGCRVWEWKPQHIEAMLVKLGLEEQTPGERPAGTRRRKKLAQRQASPQKGGHALVGDWSGGLGLHPHHHASVAAAAYHGHGHGHHVARHMMPPSSDDFGGPACQPPSMTPAEEDALIEQVFSRDLKLERSLSPDTGSCSGSISGGSSSMEGISYDNPHHGNDGGGSRRPSAAAISRELNHQGSQRVARQVCDQLLHQQHQQQ